MRRASALLCALLLLSVPAAALAACPKTSLGDIEDEVMCPVCGTSLALATEAPQAQREREFIGGLIDGCRSKDQVKAALVAEFGPEVLALPEDEGFDLAAHLVPVLAVLAAVAGVSMAALRWRRTRPAAVKPSGSHPSAGDSARLERDLDRYDL